MSVHFNLLHHLERYKQAERAARDEAAILRRDMARAHERLSEAADRITALESENRRLRAAVEAGERPWWM